MAVPAFKEFLLPTLKRYGDSSEHTLGELLKSLGDDFGLSDTDRAEMLESGMQTRLHNRVAWAHVYLAKAKLLDRVARSRYRITEKGKKLLVSKPVEITPAFLRDNYPEFRDFASSASRATEGDTGASPPNDESASTPEERLEAGYQTLRLQLAQQLLDRIKTCSPAFFERLVIDLLVAMGYGGSRIDAGKAVGRVGDGGIDGIIKEDRLGLDAIYIQAKRWESSVGRPIVQAFVGALAGRKANKGVLITTSLFTQDAKAYVDGISQKVTLIDGAQLAEFMIDSGVGVTPAATYSVKRVDSDYFEEE